METTGVLIMAIAVAAVVVAAVALINRPRQARPTATPSSDAGTHWAPAVDSGDAGVDCGLGDAGCDGGGGE